MYTGKNKTAITSQEMIATAFYELLQTKEIAAISISELCQAAKVSRQTFYSLFTSKENIVIYLLIRHYPADIPHYLEGKDPMTLTDICHCFAIYMKSCRPLIDCIIRNGLSRLLAIAFYHGILQCPHPLFTCPNKQYQEYFAYFLAGGLASIAEKYTRNKQDMTLEELEHLTLDLFHGKYFHT